MATTYVVRTNSGFDTRSSETMNYTHAVVGISSKDEGKDVAYTWHTSEELAHKGLQQVAKYADQPGTLRVVPVEAHQGTKATVTKRLAAGIELQAQEAPVPAPKRGREKTGDPRQDRAGRAAQTAKAQAKLPKPTASKAAQHGWDKDTVTKDGFTIVWPHGYYALLKRPIEGTRKFEWVAEMADGKRLPGKSVADAEAQARAYGRKHGLVTRKATQK